MDKNTIQRYLNGELNQDELLHWNEFLIKNPEFEKEVKEMEEVVKAIKKYPSYKLKEKLLNKERLQQSNAVQSKAKFNRKFLVVLGLILSFIFAIYFIISVFKIKEFPKDNLPEKVDSIGAKKTFFAEQDTNRLLDSADKFSSNKTKRLDISNELYAAHFEIYKDDFLVTETRGEHPTTYFDQFCIAYLAGEFNKALILFDKLDVELQNNGNIKFYKAMAFLACKDIKDAIPILNQVIKQGKSRYILQAHWYLSLCYLKLNRMNEAKYHLMPLIKNGDTTAQKLITKI